MTLKLSSKWSEQLILLPETGMGYQRVSVHLKSGKVISDLIVENAEELTIPETVEPFDEAEIVDITLSK